MKHIKRTALQFVMLCCASATLGFASSRQDVPPLLRNAIDDEKLDLSKGVFLLNEDWFGHNNSSLYFLEDIKDRTETEAWNIHYGIFRQANPGKSLGCTSQYGIIYGDHLYISSKQEQDGGDDLKGSRFCMTSTKNLALEYEYEQYPTKNTDGRALLGVDTAKIYVGTSNGVFVFNPQTKTMSEKCIAGTENEGADGDEYTALYYHQCGMMLRVGDRVYITHQSKGIIVVNPQADTIIHVIPNVKDPKDEKVIHGYGSIVLGVDGFIYASLNKDTGQSGEAAPYLVKINPVTYEESIIEVPSKVEVDGKSVTILPPSNSWYAWAADGLRSAPKERAIYWSGKSSKFLPSQDYFRYDLDSGKFSHIFGTSDLSKSFYGSAFGINPISGNINAILFKSYASSSGYEIIEFTPEGKTVTRQPMSQHYHFPALFIYPDNAQPVAKAIDSIVFDTNDEATMKPVELNLLDYVSDVDNNNQAIWSSIASVSTPDIVTTKLEMNHLTITPEASEGTTTINIMYNSNGKVVESPINITIKAKTAINSVSAAEQSNVYYHNGELVLHDLSGSKVALYNMSGVLVYRTAVRDAHEVRAVELEPGVYVAYIARNGNTETVKVMVK